MEILDAEIIGGAVRGNHDRPSESLDGSSGLSTTTPKSSSEMGEAGDPLSDVLDTVRLRGSLFFVWEPSWPYDTGVPNGRTFANVLHPGADQIISYHIVTEGPCWGWVEGENPVRLDSGDILLLPHGDAYVIGNEPRAPSETDIEPAMGFFNAMAAGELPPVIVDGGGGPQQNRIICGFLGCDMHPYNPLLASLPRLVHLPKPTDINDPLSSLIEFALLESRQRREGGRSLLLRLSEAMFVEVIRRYLRTAALGGSDWLCGLRDPVVSRALNKLHRDIAYPWTVEKLAEAIGSSRSTLAERFTRCIGAPPMTYLTHWRIQVAARLLKDHGAKNYSIARQVGYESEAAFSRAFKRTAGVSPQQWRTRHGIGNQSSADNFGD